MLIALQLAIFVFSVVFFYFSRISFQFLFRISVSNKIPFITSVQTKPVYNIFQKITMKTLW